MSQESEISWQMLRRIVHDWVGAASELQEVKPLDGGCINTTLALTLADSRKAVLKISPHRVNRSYQQEAFHLRLLADLGLPVPRVYECRIGSLDDPHSYILMEFVKGIDLNQARRDITAGQFDDVQTHLAELLLALHSATASHYMRVSETDGQRFDRWPDFYRHVFDPIWADVESGSMLPVKVRRQVGRINEKLDQLLVHDDVPRLVHWDVWATNILAHPDDSGRWRVAGLLDPNCKFAHFETEFAYMELFHTITPAFLRRYQQVRKLPPEYHRIRKPVYQMYCLLNHVHLFGAAYVKPLLAAVDRVTSL